MPTQIHEAIWLHFAFQSFSNTSLGCFSDNELRTNSSRNKNNGPLDMCFQQKYHTFAPENTNVNTFAVRYANFCDTPVSNMNKR